MARNINLEKNQKTYVTSCEAPLFGLFLSFCGSTCVKMVRDSDSKLFGQDWNVVVLVFLYLVSTTDTTEEDDFWFFWFDEEIEEDEDYEEDD